MATTTSGVAAAEQTPAIDLSPLAPPFRQQADLRLLALYFALLAATQIRAHASPSEEEFVAYVGPFVLLIASAGYAGANLKAQTSRYVTGLLNRAKLPHDPQNVELAAGVFRYRTSESAVTIAFAIATVVGLWVSYSNLFWSVRDFDISTWNTSFVSLIHLLFFLALLGVACLAAFAPTALTRPAPLDFNELVENSSVSNLQLEESDRNDVDLVATSVALDSLHRRVETYTIESTLLSALSFSAFTAIIYSDVGPIETPAWLASLKWVCIEGSRLCYPELTAADFQSHAMFITAACLLACAVFFLAVLVTRLRFNDAFRYTEELLKTAQALDKKEENGPKKLRPQLTQEIGRLLDRAKHGLADLQPMILFMKVFRELGILAFVGAVATCGVIFHWTISVAILLFLAAVLVFGYADKLRRKSNFLPRLQNTIVSLGAKHRPS